MSTSVNSVTTGDTVAFKFFGGKERGPMVQMEVTEHEFASFRSMQVSEETDPDSVETFGDWFDRMVREGRTVVWDNAHRNNEMARCFETNRFTNDAMKRMAEEFRTRARECVRQTMRGM